MVKHFGKWFEVYENDPKGNKPISFHAKNDTGQKMRGLIMPMHGHNAEDFRFKTEEEVEADWQKAREAADLAAIEEVKRQERQDAGEEEEDNGYMMEEDDPTQQDALQELAQSTGPYTGDDVMRTPKPEDTESLPGVE